MAGPCADWVTQADVENDPTAANVDWSLAPEAVTVASQILYALSGRQFPGVCTDTVRPCRRLYYLEHSPPAWWAWEQSWGITTFNRPGERYGGCAPLPEITLGVYPLRSITEILIDGQVLDPSAYAIHDRRWLIRIDGDNWPGCQRLDLPATELDTFQVSDTWGTPPPASGKTAARMLAIELAKSMSGNPCNLPQRVQSITAQGVSYALLDPLTFLDKGRTGIYYVDLFLAAVNPKGLRRRASVLSPDIPRPVRRIQ